MSNTMFPVRVARKATEAEGIYRFELVDPDGGLLPAFSAGSHIDVQAADGLVRQYSLCNCPSEQHRYVIAVLRDPNSRGGSVAIHDTIHQGDLIRISEPRNHFRLAHGARRSLLLAGGIGVTPILGMSEHLAKNAAPFEMHYFVRSESRAAFLDRIRASSFSDQVRFHFDDSAPEQKADLAHLLSLPEPGLHLYVCGPAGFLDAVISTAKAQGWSEANVHFEYFSARVAERGSDDAFDVKLASTGKVLHVPAGCSVTVALAQAGLAVPVSCEQGVCGTCLTRVLDGVPDHRDHYLSKDEQAANDQFLPCCSRSKSSLLVLDL